MLHTISFHASLLGRELDENIKATNAHVLIYGAVEVHSFGEKGCIASNETIGVETGMTKGTVAKCLSQIAKARWVEVALKNGRRMGIVPLLTIQPPLPPSKPPFTTQSTPLYHPVNRDNNIDKSLDNSILTDSNESAQVAEIINQFALKIDPKNKQNYGRIPQRDACKFLIKNYGYSETLEMIENISKIKTMLHPASLATTPFELKEKWQKILSEVAHKISIKKQQEFYQNKDEKRNHKTLII
jgi:hypothetical protein